MKKAIRFSVIVCLFSWAVFAAARFGFGLDFSNPGTFTIFATIYMFFPMITAILCIWMYDKHIAKDNICSMTLGDALER